MEQRFLITNMREYLSRHHEDILVEVVPPGVWLVRDEIFTGLVYLSPIGDRVMRLHSDPTMLKLELTLNKETYVGIFGEEAFELVVNRL